MLAETEKLVECERRLYESEQQLATSRSQNVRLQLRLDELRLKLEPCMLVHIVKELFFVLLRKSINFLGMDLSLIDGKGRLFRPLT